MKKIYGYCVTKNSDQLAVAITEDGHTIVVTPSLPEQAEAKLGMGFGSTEQHWKYEAFFKEEEWETEFIPSLSIENHSGLQVALEKERKKFDNEFSAVRQKLASKDPDDAKRMRERSGVKIADVESMQAMVEEIAEAKEQFRK